MKAIRMHTQGGPELLTFEDVQNRLSSPEMHSSTSSLHQPATSGEKLCCKWLPPNPRKHSPLSSVRVMTSPRKVFEPAAALRAGSFIL
jgi:hypothetical protein